MHAKIPIHATNIPRNANHPMQTIQDTSKCSHALNMHTSSSMEPPPSPPHSGSSGGSDDRERRTVQPFPVRRLHPGCEATAIDVRRAPAQAAVEESLLRDWRNTIVIIPPTSQSCALEKHGASDLPTGEHAEAHASVLRHQRSLSAAGPGDPSPPPTRAGGPRGRGPLRRAAAGPRRTRPQRSRAARRGRCR